LVEAAQPGRNSLPDFGTRDFSVKVMAEFTLDSFDEILFALFGHRSLATRGENASQDVLAVKRHTRAVLLDHDEASRGLGPFVGCESPRAALALSPAAHDMAAVGTPAVDDFVVVLIAAGADH
jgi:hypothetical protein